MADAKMLNLDKVKARLAKIPAQMKEAAEAQLKVEVDELVAAIRRAAPVKTGVLKSTIRAKPGERPLSFVVSAGGPETTKKIRAGVSDRDFAKAKVSGGNHGEFDYSRADEFGHLTHTGQHVPAHPFFFVTYRARRKAMKRRMLAASRKVAKDLEV